MSSPRHAPRPWIGAAASFAAQPDMLRALPAHLGDQLRHLPGRPDRVLVVGIGASYAAAAAAVRVMRSYRIDATRHLPGELPAADGGELVLAISQSGRSAEVVEYARTVAPQRLLAVTNYHPSPLGDLCGHCLNLGDHADSSVSFLSFTGTLVALGMLAEHWTGQVRLDRWQAVVDSAIRCAQSATPKLDQSAEVLATGQFIDIAAPAALVGAAEEAALMFREGPRVPATGMDTRHYLHGPMDAAGDGAHLILGGEREPVLAKQLAERTDRVVYIGTAPAELPPEAAVAFQADLPHTDPIGEALCATMMTQYLALRVADLRGVDIDEPAFTGLDTKPASAG